MRDAIIDNRLKKESIRQLENLEEQYTYVLSVFLAFNVNVASYFLTIS